jgi:hypothetical protein
MRRHEGRPRGPNQLGAAGQRVAVTVAGADAPQGEDLGVVVFGDISDGNRAFMDIHSNRERARLWHG